jgi:hypothetical protein
MFLLLLACTVQIHNGKYLELFLTEQEREKTSFAISFMLKLQNRRPYFDPES